MGEGIYVSLWLTGASQVRLAVKSLLAKAGDIRDVGFIPGLGRSPGGGNGNPLQCSCLGNPKDRGTWWAPVHRAARSWTRLNFLNWIASHQAPLSLGFPRQEHWSGLSFHSPGDFPNPGAEPMSPVLAGSFF